MACVVPDRARNRSSCFSAELQVLGRQDCLLHSLSVIDHFGFRENFKIDYEDEDDSRLSQQSLGCWWTTRLEPQIGRNGRPGYGTFAQRSGTAGTDEFVQFAARQDQQQPFAHRLGATAFRAIEFTGGKGLKLLRHAAKPSPGDAKYQTALWPGFGPHLCGAAACCRKN